MERTTSLPRTTFYIHSIVYLHSLGVNTQYYVVVAMCAIWPDLTQTSTRINAHILFKMFRFWCSFVHLFFCSFSFLFFFLWSPCNRSTGTLGLKFDRHNFFFLDIHKVCFWKDYEHLLTNIQSYEMLQTQEASLQLPPQKSHKNEFIRHRDGHRKLSMSCSHKHILCFTRYGRNIHQERSLISRAYA